MGSPTQAKTVNLSREEQDLHVNLGGVWELGVGLEDLKIFSKEIKKSKPESVFIHTEKVETWDSSLLAFVLGCLDICKKEKIKFKYDMLSEGVKELVELSQAVPTKEVDERGRKESFIYKMGSRSLGLYEGVIEMLAFAGESFSSLVRVASGKGRSRWRDFTLLVQEVSIEALPIVALISFLVGFIMAFVAAAQLKQFGASIYVADLVGLAMVREMGAMMAAIIMAGRTGSAFAATIGSMKVTEELDALRTTGISPMDFLVIPRIGALFLMMPLLCLFADFIGILGGFIVSMTLLDVSFQEYLHETQLAISLTDIFVGVSKSTVFGALIALSGCLRGMQCGNSSDAVGIASTSAVVTAITSIIITDAIFAVLYDGLGI